MEGAFIVATVEAGTYLVYNPKSSHDSGRFGKKSTFSLLALADPAMPSQVKTCRNTLPLKLASSVAPALFEAEHHYSEVVEADS